KHDIDIPDVDTQLKGAAGEADRRLGLGELALDLVSALGFDIRVMNEHGAAEWRARPYRGGVRLDLGAAVAEDQRLSPAMCAKRGPGVDQRRGAVIRERDLLGFDRPIAGNPNDVGAPETTRRHHLRLSDRRRQSGVL